MFIKSLSQKFKTDDQVYLYEAINMVGEKLYADKWKNNTFIEEMPFVEKQHRTLNNCHNIDVEVFEFSRGKIKPCIYEYELEEPLLVQLREAFFMATAVKEKLWQKIMNGQLPYQVRLKGNNIPSTHFPSKIWSHEVNKIYTSGYFPTSTKGKRQWGILLFKRQDVLECAEIIANPNQSSSLGNSIKKKDVPKHAASNESKFDPRERKSLQKIILAMTIKSHRRALIGEHFHSIGKIIESDAITYGLSIDFKTVADAIKKIWESDEWEGVKKEVHDKENPVGNQKLQ